jgi:hypothetical protein
VWEYSNYPVRRIGASHRNVGNQSTNFGTLTATEHAMDLSGTIDVWFRPKRFESERLYERLGALLLKRYVPTGGDLVMRRLRRDHPERRWVTSSPESLRKYEKRTRLNESIHLLGFAVFMVLIAKKFVSGSLSAFGLTIALVLNMILGLWPVVLQRYNRLRLYRAIGLCSRLPHR